MGTGTGRAGTDQHGGDRQYQRGAAPRAGRAQVHVGAQNPEYWHAWPRRDSSHGVSWGADVGQMGGAQSSWVHCHLSLAAHSHTGRHAMVSQVTSRVAQAVPGSGVSSGSPGGVGPSQDHWWVPRHSQRSGSLLVRTVQRRPGDQHDGDGAPAAPAVAPPPAVPPAAPLAVPPAPVASAPASWAGPPPAPCPPLAPRASPPHPAHAARTHTAPAPRTMRGP